MAPTNSKTKFKPSISDEMADAPFAPAALDERLESGSDSAATRDAMVEMEPVEFRPILQHRRDHRRNPADLGMGQKPHFAAQQSAVKSLVELAQVRRRASNRPRRPPARANRRSQKSARSAGSG